MRKFAHEPDHLRSLRAGVPGDVLRMALGRRCARGGLEWMTYRQHMRACARAYLSELLERHPDARAAAAAAGVNRTHFYVLLKRHGLHEPFDIATRYGNAEWRGLEDAP